MKMKNILSAKTLNQRATDKLAKIQRNKNKGVSFAPTEERWIPAKNSINLMQRKGIDSICIEKEFN
jgi:hypothetical protein